MASKKRKGKAFKGLGKALRWIRQRQGKKQYEVADAAGVTKAMLSSYENDKQRPAIDTLERILDALGIDLDYLAHAIRMVRQEEQRQAGRSESGQGIRPASLVPELDVEHVLGLDRHLAPGEERAVGQMLDGYHNLLRFMLKGIDSAANPQAAAPPAASEEADEGGEGGGPVS